MRIVSLLSSATEILFALDVGDCVVAVSHECDYPVAVSELPRVTFSRVNTKHDSAKIDQQVNEMAQSGAALYEVDRQRIVELAPDMIVTQSQCDVCAVRYQDLIMRITGIFRYPPTTRGSAGLACDSSLGAGVVEGTIGIFFFSVPRALSCKFASR